MIKDRIQSYYRTERISSVVLSMVGAFAASVGLGNFIWFKSELSMGIMLGLCLVGSYQIIVGLVRLYRSRNRYKKAIEDVDHRTAHLSNSEYPRLLKKEELLHRIRKIELSTIVFSILSLVLFIVFRPNNYLLGTIGGLCFHAAFLLCFDLFSHFRIQEYIRQLEKYLKL